MLQQTRAQAVIPYYEKFLTLFPTPVAMANASESEVLAAWSGLGYYSRARNLQRAARAIAEQTALPNTYAALLQLPGIGSYTAAAVASIAFGEPHAVLDGNVLRVVARMCNDPANIAAGVTRKRFQLIADEWLDPRRPAEFNQAIMELGATVCLPRAPLCLLCPVAALCEARQAGTQKSLPVKTGKPKATQHGGHIVIAERKGALLLRQRGEGEARMAKFWELPSAEDLPSATRLTAIGTVRHTIVNNAYTIHVSTAKLAKAPKGCCFLDPAAYELLPLTSISKKALKLHRGTQQAGPVAAT
jgi:A/G-specific adenine glycosylase